MSDVQQGPGWWLASDGRWYPPQPGAPTAPVPPTAPQPPGQPPAAAAGRPVKKSRVGGLVAAVVGGIALLVSIIPIVGLLSIPFALAAAVLGVLGVVNPKGGGKVLSAVGATLGVLALGVSAIYIFAVGSAINDKIGTADPSSYQLIDQRCSTDSVGNPRFSATIRNTSKRARGFAVTVAFVVDGRTIAHGDAVTQDAIEINESTTVSYSKYAEASGGLQCKILEVSYLG